MEKEKRHPRSYKAKDTPYFKAQKIAVKRKTNLCEVIERFVSDYATNKNPFVFYKHTLAFSVDDSKETGAVPSDLMLEGNPADIVSAIVQQMDKHPIIETVIYEAAMIHSQKKQKN